MTLLPVLLHHNENGELMEVGTYESSSNPPFVLGLR